MPLAGIIGVVAQALVAAGTVKSAANPPMEVTVALVKVTAVARLFVSVTVCATVGVPTAVEVNDRLVGETAKSAGAVPVSATVCGLEGSPSMIVSVADSEVVVAVKVTLMVHVPPEAGMVAPQVLPLMAKSVPAGTALVMAALVNAIAVLVLLVSVTVCGAVITPCAVAVNVKETGEIINVGSRVSEATKASDEPFSEAPCGMVVTAGKTGKFAENV